MTATEAIKTASVGSVMNTVPQNQDSSMTSSAPKINSQSPQPNVVQGQPNAVQQQQQVARAQQISKTAQTQPLPTGMPSLPVTTQDEFKSSASISEAPSGSAVKPTQTATQGAIQGFKGQGDAGQGGLGSALTSGKSSQAPSGVALPSQQQLAKQESLKPTALGQQFAQSAQVQASPIQQAKALLAQLPVIGPLLASKNPVLNPNKNFNAQWLQGPSKEPLVPQFFVPGQNLSPNYGKVAPNGSYPPGRRSQLFYTYAANKALSKPPVNPDFEVLAMQQAFPEMMEMHDEPDRMSIEIKKFDDEQESTFNPEAYV